MSQAERAETFRALHEADPFVIPNPWDAGSAKVLQYLGFKALATTSGGMAFTVGQLDGNVTLDQVIDTPARSPKRASCRFRLTSRTATATLPRMWPERSRGQRRRARSEVRSRTGTGRERDLPAEPLPREQADIRVPAATG
jgi:Phosphoenolpyruvate phosphomutase